MEIKITIPEELVQSVKRIADSFEEAVNDARGRMEKEVEEFNTEEYKRRTESILSDIKEALEEGTDTVAEDIDEALKEARKDLKGFLGGLFGGIKTKTSKVPADLRKILQSMGIDPDSVHVVDLSGTPEDDTTKPEEDLSEPQVNMIDILLVELGQLDARAASWLSEAIVKDIIPRDRQERAMKVNKPCEALYFLLRGDNSVWVPTPQGEFFWTSVYKELGCDLSC